ncbi:hypothetical protein Zmor_017546 [Zophobas morio]|uniref:Uncharacterized protein n=1 Tax=Zophobas morio TaxID=2755281 RepID=A0AA38I9S9_9CUCU|nr:hypothetical protein Zmor_017546 [Zophobas morio]
MNETDLIDTEIAICQNKFQLDLGREDNSNIVTEVDLMDNKITTENEENINNEENKNFVCENTEEHINANMSKFHKTQKPVEEVDRKNEHTDDDSVIINTEEAINVKINENCNSINKAKQPVRDINTAEKTDNNRVEYSLEGTDKKTGEYNVI